MSGNQGLQVLRVSPRVHVSKEYILRLFLMTGNQGRRVLKGMLVFRESWPWAAGFVL